jgi:murein DD-endopeptidase MepM/ murein hydrolase activator NlpD
MVVIDHGYGFVTRYGHLDKAMVKKGQKVKRGDVIALMGNTGYSTGPHLHYEVWRNNKVLDPRDFILNEM